MRPINGFQMLEILRALDTFADTKIVAITASVMTEEVERLRNFGFDACFSKPIDLDVFPENLQRILNGDSIWDII